GRLVVDAWVRDGTFYAVTTQRLGVATHVRSPRTSWFELEDVDRVTLVEWRDGGGDVAFGQLGRIRADCSIALGVTPTQRNRGLPVPGPGHYDAPHFDMVDDARALH